MYLKPEFIGGTEREVWNEVNEYKLRNRFPYEGKRYMIIISSRETTYDNQYFDYVVVTNDASLDSILGTLIGITDDFYDFAASSILLSYYKKQFFKQYTFSVVDVLEPHEDVEIALKRNSYTHTGAYFTDAAQ